MADTKEGIKEIAKLAESSDRYEDMAENMKIFVERYGEEGLNDEERNLLSVAYKNIVGTKRASYKILQSESEKINGVDKVNETDESSKKDAGYKKEVVSQMKQKVKAELQEVCNEVIRLLDDYLLKNAEKSGEAKVKVFYNKMKGDYFRYQVEVAEGSSEREEMSNKAHDAYEKADAIAQELEPTDPIRLGLALNYSVFFYEIKEDHDRACHKAKSSFDAAFAKLDDVEESGEVFKDTTLIMQLLRDNLTLWRSEEQQAQEEDL